MNVWDPSSPRMQRLQRSLGRRRRREWLFRRLGGGAATIGIAFLSILIVALFAKGGSAFFRAELELPVYFDPQLVAPAGTYDIAAADLDAVARIALAELFPDVRSRDDLRGLGRLLSIGATFELGERLTADPGLIGQRATVSVPASSLVDRVLKGRVDRQAEESRRVVTDRQLGWIDTLESDGRLRLRFNKSLFTNGDSREPELAGIRGALTGSLLMILITAVLAIPLGVAAAIYLEEFATSGRLTDLIEVNINNLAAVPSIIYGLLGLAIFIDLGGLPRSAPIVGGLVLTLLTLPVVIISARSAIAAVPDAIRDAALALGASRMQVVFEQVLPLALPGILTGAVVGLSRALGESAPLLMIGMVAFIVDVPDDLTDPATAMPVQIFLWADSPEPGFAELTAAATLVLLAVLLLLSIVVAALRQRLLSR